MFFIQRKGTWLSWSYLQSSQLCWWACHTCCSTPSRRLFNMPVDRIGVARFICTRAKLQELVILVIQPLPSLMAAAYAVVYGIVSVRFYGQAFVLCGLRRWCCLRSHSKTVSLNAKNLPLKNWFYCPTFGVQFRLPWEILNLIKKVQYVPRGHALLCPPWRIKPWSVDKALSSGLLPQQTLNGSQGLLTLYVQVKAIQGWATKDQGFALYGCYCWFTI